MSGRGYGGPGREPLRLDARRESRLQKLMEAELAVPAEEFARCWRPIEKIVANKISKYNHAPLMIS